MSSTGAGRKGGDAGCPTTHAVTQGHTEGGREVSMQGMGRAVEAFSGTALLPGRVTAMNPAVTSREAAMVGGEGTVPCTSQSPPMAMGMVRAMPTVAGVAPSI